MDTSWMPLPHARRVVRIGGRKRSIRGLYDYKVEISVTTGHDSYNARVGDHDDLVLAVWFRSRFWKHWDRQAERIGKTAAQKLEGARR